MQLDLFGFPLEEKPAKKQEKKAGVEKTPPKQDNAPLQAKTAEPVAEEYTEVNIHVIPGLRQISILDAEAAANVPAVTAANSPAPAESEQPATAVTTQEPVAEETAAFEAIPAEPGQTPVEAQPGDEIPVEVLEAMAKETAMLEEEHNGLEMIAETPALIEETPGFATQIAAAADIEQPFIEQENFVVIPPVAPAGEETAAEYFAEVQAVEQANQPVEEIAAVVAEARLDDKKPGANVDDTVEVALENVLPPTNTEELPGDQIVTPTGGRPEPAKIHAEEEPELVIYASGEAGVDDNAIDFNQTLFSKQSVEEMVSPAKKAALTAKGKRGRKSFKDIDAEIALVEVPGDDELFQKLYYPISQVAQWFNVNTSLLRFWENEFDILKPRKNRKGDRLFRPEDVKNLQVIYHLLRQRKFSIEGAKKYIKQNKSRAEINIQLIQSLTKFRSFLLEMKANLGA